MLIQINIIEFRQKIILNVNNTDTIKQVKIYIDINKQGNKMIGLGFAKSKLPEEQRLFHNGKILLENNTLEYYNIIENSKIYLILSN